MEDTPYSMEAQPDRRGYRVVEGAALLVAREVEGAALLVEREAEDAALLERLKARRSSRG